MKYDRIKSADVSLLDMAGYSGVLSLDSKEGRVALRSTMIRLIKRYEKGSSAPDWLLNKSPGTESEYVIKRRAAQLV